MSGSQTSLSGDLTLTEEQLVETVLAGRRVDLKGETIRASILSTLITEVRSDWALPPIGLLLDNAVIQGTLDLEGCADFKTARISALQIPPAPEQGISGKDQGSEEPLDGMLRAKSEDETARSSVTSRRRRRPS